MPLSGGAFQEIGRIPFSAREDGRLVPGFLCEAHAVADAEDITALGDWRKYLATQA